MISLAKTVHSPTHHLVTYLFGGTLLYIIVTILGYEISPQYFFGLTLMCYLTVNIILYNRYTFFTFIAGVTILFFYTLYKGNIKFLPIIESYFKVLKHSFSTHQLGLEYHIPTITLLTIGVFILLFFLKFKLTQLNPLWYLVPITVGYLVCTYYSILHQHIFLLLHLSACILYYLYYYIQPMPFSPIKSMVTLCSLLLIAFSLVGATQYLRNFTNSPLDFVEALGSWIDKEQDHQISYERSIRYLDVAPLETLVDTIDTTVMTIESDDAFYLNASTLQTFTADHEWVDSDTEIMDNTPYDALLQQKLGYFLLTHLDPTDKRATLPAYDINKLQGAKLPIVEAKMNVTLENIQTKHLFAPTHVQSIKPTYPDASLEIRSTHAGNYRSNQSLTAGFEYEVTSIIPRYRTTNLYDRLRKSYVGLDEDLSRMTYYKDFYIPDPNVDLYTGLDKNHQPTYRLKADAAELLNQIIVDKNTNLDKVIAIENYLASNYKYLRKLNRKTPAAADYVSYFLFNRTEGYCTFFATSMALMVRELGLPARYVRGFKMPPKPKDFENPVASSTTYTMLQTYAHAWVEVYFEGFGWVPFEPTSGYHSQYLETFYEPAVIPKPKDTPTQPTPPVKELPHGSSFTVYLFNLMWIVPLFVIVICITAYLFWRRRRINLRNSMPLGEQYIYYYSQLIKLLGIHGYEKSSSETTLKYAIRLSDKGILCNDDIDLLGLTTLFESTLYGNHPITVDQLSKLRLAEQNLRQYTKKGQIKYMFYLFDPR